MRFFNCLKKLAFIIIISLSLQACMVAMIGAGVGAVKYANSKKMHAYNEYVLGIEKLNIERQKFNLKPKYIMTYKEYFGTSTKK
jgi:hypothetical protein